ncbi:hypothetical protein DNTS_032610 [Danionella cerebrum]|uniref:Cilia- and flagella-associated protein 410 n=1 Tax=Danionella cerebrum TaxID=2873325 RepID=A0A553PYB8_9TELE|nr:hypothetical protein DNTS_032610 [Danionella translucida]
MKLTRKLVLARAKASDLESVKKLNCWGCNLTDISIFEQIPNIEVLTLSVNQISSLEALSRSLHLSELYLRRNSIPLSQIYFLKALTRLRVLWLSENPCSQIDQTKYRLTVIRNLPTLHKLDNQGEELVSPPGTIQSTNGFSEADSENDPLHYSMEETNNIRAQLGLKPLTRDKFPLLSSPRDSRDSQRRKAHTLEAVLLLLKDLDMEELKIVQLVTESKIKSREEKEHRKTPEICF